MNNHHLLNLHQAARGALTCALIACASAAPQPAPEPLPNAHSHNDYAHARPLLDALEHGFCSVEADIFLVDGELLVAHDRRETRPGRTLEALYLAPLEERVRRNQGSVYRPGASFWLLIDIKSDAEPTYARLRATLERYAGILTKFTSQGVKTNAVTVVISGNRPIATMAAEALRYAGVDGRSEDLERDVDPRLMPLISENWRKLFQWNGAGSFPAEERQKLHRLAGRARELGCRLRFWATPDRPVVWRELAEARVDLINADDLAGLRDFLLETRK